MGLETMMSDNDTWLLERSFADLWNPSRHVGVYYTISNDRAAAVYAIWPPSSGPTY